MPTARLLVLALLAAVPLAAGTTSPPLVLIALLYVAGLIAVVVMDFRAAPDRHHFHVERRHEPRLSLGEPNPVELHVRLAPRRGLRAARSLRLWARDECPTPIPVDQRILSGTIRYGGEWVGRYYLTPLRRGDYEFGPVHLRVESPLGLTVRQLTFPIDAPVHVYPNLRAVRRYDLLARRGRLHEAGLRQSKLFGRGTEFERLRDYLPDDDYRRVNWKATARRWQPVTVEYETERSQNLVVVLDTGRLMATPVGPLLKLDYAVNAALMLTRVAAQLGDRIGMLTFADEVVGYLPPARGRRQFHLMLESLYNVRPQPVEPDPARALSYLAARQTKRSLVIVFTDLVEATDAEALVTHLGVLSRRHLAFCVTIADPDLPHLAATDPSSSRSAYEKVVAQRLVDERRAVLDRLEKRGVLTIDVAADRLTAGVVNHYLEVKARTQL
ncbi:MAG: DUF58 domain-containing protein [Chloroflexi bacterium]|nr:DUF58 domain-containing protein [Chloroflexota bacterium]